MTGLINGSLAPLRESFTRAVPALYDIVSKFIELAEKNECKFAELWQGKAIDALKHDLGTAITFLVHNIDQPARVREFLAQKAGALRNADFSTEHFTDVSNVLSAALAYFFGSRWNAEFDAAWRAGLAIVHSSYVDGRATATFSAGKPGGATGLSSSAAVAASTRTPAEPAFAALASEPTTAAATATSVAQFVESDLASFNMPQQVLLPSAIRDLVRAEARSYVRNAIIAEFRQQAEEEMRKAGSEVRDIIRAALDLPLRAA